MSGGGTTRVFDISNVSGRSSHVLINDLTIGNGMATGPTVPGTGISTVLTDGGPVTLGGGILNMGDFLILDDVTLVNNQANASVLGRDNQAGGGIANVFGAASRSRTAASKATMPWPAPATPTAAGSTMTPAPP